MRLIIIAIISSCLASCSFFMVPNQIKKRFTFCYDGKNTSVNSLINIKGFYKKGELWDKYGINNIKEHTTDTFYTNFMFFADGICAYNFSNDKKYVDSVAIDKEHNVLYGYLNGLYRVFGDTIKIQLINPGVSGVWAAYEEWYKIIDRNTLQYIGAKPLFKADMETFQKSITEEIHQSFPAFFVPVDTLPSSGAWLKKKKWFWCKKKDWKEYKRKQKENK